MENRKYTKEDIEQLKKEDPALLSPEERRLANLTPFKKGEVSNPNGRKKGVKSWSTHFKRLMGDEKLLRSIISSKPSAWEGIVEDIPADVIAAGLIASVTKDVAKAIAEGRSVDNDTLRAIDTLNKLGWGDNHNVQVESEQGFFEKPVINFIVREDRKTEEEE